MLGASAAKALVSESFQTDGVAGVNAAAAAYNNAANAAEHRSKYFSAIAITAGTGEITVTTAAAATSGLPADAALSTLVFTPNVQNAALARLSGAVDWACASTTGTTAGNRGLTAVTVGSLPAKYAPAECR